MALTAALAAAVAAFFAAVALGDVAVGSLHIPPALYAVALVPGVLLARTRPTGKVLPKVVVRRLILAVLGAGALVLYLVRAQAEDAAALGSAAVLVIVALSVLWPEPGIVRLCFMLGAGGLMGAPGTFADLAVPIAGFSAATAVGLVAVHRLLTTQVVEGAARRPDPRRVAREAGALLAIAGLLAAAIALLLPAPDQGGGGGGDEPSDGEQAEGEPPVPYLDDNPTLDAGGRDPDDGKQVVLRVRADEGRLWRTQTYDRWDGRTWQQSPQLAAADLQLVQSSLGFSVINASAIDRQDGRTLDQRVTVEAAAARVLPAAGRPYTLRYARGVAAVGRDRTIRIQPPLGRGATYFVQSVLPPDDESLLRAQRPVAPAEALILRPYLDLPPLGAATAGLAASLTADGVSAYDEVEAIRGWLAANTRLARDPESLPAGADPVERFLADRTGTAQQAATTLAVLARAAGLPSRFAVGFLPGERSSLDDEFTVRARHAHAWVEVWFPETGWVAFDATGRFTGPVPVDDSAASRLLDLLKSLWWVLVLVALAVAAVLVVRALRRRREQEQLPWPTRVYARLVDAGGQQGRPRQSHETPREYTTALAGTTGDERLAEVGEVITAAAYSGREPPEDARAWTEAVVTETEEEARRLQRRRRMRVPIGARR